MHSIYDFIITASHTQCDIDKLQEQFDVLVRNNNLNELFKNSYLHGVFPLVYSKLKLLVVDENILQVFKEQSRDIAQMNMQRTNELLQVVELFDSNNINYIAIKGPVLSKLIHGDISKRQYTDLDILIEKSSAFKVGKLLIDNDYKESHQLKYLQNKTLLKIAKDFKFTHKKTNNILEVHWKLFANKDMSENKLSLFFSNFQNVLISQKVVKTLDMEYLLIYLSLHGSKHQWERLAWIVDIDRLISQNSLKWDLIEEIVSDIENEKMFYLGLLTTVELFNTNIPVKLLNKCQSYKDLVSIVEKIIASLYSNKILLNDTSNIEVGRILDMAQIKDTKKDVFKHYLLAFFQIKESDIYIINLPSFLSPLYYVIRVFRILFKLQKIK